MIQKTHSFHLFAYSLPISVCIHNGMQGKVLLFDFVRQNIVLIKNV